MRRCCNGSNKDRAFSLPGGCSQRCLDGERSPAVARPAWGWGLLRRRPLQLAIRVAVGTVLTNCPPLRSPRAALPHEALILDEWRQSELRGKDVGRADLGPIAPPVVAFAPSSGSLADRGGLEPAATAESPASGIRGGNRCYPVPRNS